MSALLPTVGSTADLDPISRSTRQLALSQFVHPLGSVAFTRGLRVVIGP